MQWRVFERGRGRCGMLHQRTARPRAPARAAARVKTPFKPVGTGPTDPRHKQSLKLRSTFGHHISLALIIQVPPLIFA